jgi:hypothetical protein
LKTIKYPDQRYKIRKDKDKLNKVKIILADKFIDNNNNLDLIFYIIPDNIDFLITSIKAIKREFYINEI